MDLMLQGLQASVLLLFNDGELPEPDPCQPAAVCGPALVLRLWLCRV